MDQKTKAMISVSIVVVLALGVGFYLIKKNKAVKALPQQPVQTAQVPQAVKEVPNEQSKPENQISNVEGKMVSINEKQLYLKLEDGKGVAINIDAKTPVKNQGNEEVKNLSDLKADEDLLVRVDEDNNAKEIIIKN